MKERERGTDQQRQTHTQKGAAARTGAKCKRNKARRKGGGARSHRNYCCCCDTHATNYTCAAITSRTQRDVALIVFSVGGFGLNPLARFPARLPAAEQQQHFLFVSFFLRVTDFPPFSQATLYTSAVHLKIRMAKNNVHRQYKIFREPSERNSS